MPQSPCLENHLRRPAAVRMTWAYWGQMLREQYQVHREAHPAHASLHRRGHREVPLDSGTSQYVTAAMARPLSTGAPLKVHRCAHPPLEPETKGVRHNCLSLQCRAPDPPPRLSLSCQLEAYSCPTHRRLRGKVTCNGLNRVPSKFKLQVLPGPQNVTVFGNKVFADVVS